MPIKGHKLCIRGGSKPYTFLAPREESSGRGASKVKGILGKCRQEMQAAKQLSPVKGDVWGHLPAPGGGPRSGSNQEKGLLFL